MGPGSAYTVIKKYFKNVPAEDKQTSFIVISVFSALEILFISKI